ncbi:hypothetical protein JD78_00954 [Modestobacter roseus]|uniref:Uncharacterized protein n=1 Tax=Modestobacter roseus TaxID=1181884 RepID=A0A562INH1_9ACTN|nr:hypothetical protein JD78_00954 [Modestobacter roseus]
MPDPAAQPARYRELVLDPAVGGRRQGLAGRGERPEAVRG